MRCLRRELGILLCLVFFIALFNNLRVVRTPEVEPDESSSAFHLPIGDTQLAESQSQENGDCALLTDSEISAYTFKLSDS